MNYENEEEIRKDFARIFEWYDTEQMYGYTQLKEKKLLTPTWAEIFAKVGALINKETYENRNRR